VIITSLISWGLVPTFACAQDLPACSQLSSSLTPDSTTCCTRTSNAGWRYALFTLGGLSVFAFVARFFLFTFYESPKFLVAKGRDKQAVEVVRAVARVNGVETALTEEELKEVESRFAACGKGGSEGASGKRVGGGSGPVGHLKILFGSAAMVRLTVLTWVCYAADYWCVRLWTCLGFPLCGREKRADKDVFVRGFVIAGNFLPKFLAERGAAENVSTAVTYRN
jgi:hypothetical protein